MSGRYKAYPEYKNSGLNWLGIVPAHWEIKRLGQFFEERREKVSDKDYAPLSVTMQGIVPQLGNAAKTEDGDNRKLVIKNDFVINSRSDRKGSSGVSPYDGSVSLISIVLTPKKIHPSFVNHLLRSYPFQEEFYRYGKGIVADLWSTNSSEMKNILIPDIPEFEQLKIANFLDHETAKIDALIDKQQQLIKLLKEKRQAVISHAVTKGLNTDVPMRNSGVEWIGEVPECWIISKFNYEIDFLEGPGILAYDFFEEGVPLLRIQDVKEEFVTDNFKTFLSPTKVKNKWDHFRVKLGDLIISCSASTGLVSEVDSRSVGAVPYTGLIRLRPKSNKITKDYIFFIVQSDMFFEQINNLQTGSTMQHFGPYHLQQMYITLPSLDEQKKVVQHIKRVVADIDRLIEKARQAVELMHERQTALISAAVTGKIDVRNWQAPASSIN